MSLGLAKKILLANPCGKVADGSSTAADPGPSMPGVRVTAYAFQIYFDFSGYSDMAIGLGLMLGFVFAKNFDSPYKSHSITEFPAALALVAVQLAARLPLYFLGGNRKGLVRTYINLALVMLLAACGTARPGLIVWGGIQGFSCASNAYSANRASTTACPAWSGSPWTFLITLISWVFFRAPDRIAAWQYPGCMLGQGGAGGNAAPCSAASSISPFTCWPSLWPGSPG